MFCYAVLCCVVLCVPFYSILHSYNPASGVGLFLGPGGHGAFIIENTEFFGDASFAIAANQHCKLVVGPNAAIVYITRQSPTTSSFTANTEYISVVIYTSYEYYSSYKIVHMDLFKTIVSQ